jgi:hypothetical protein
MFEGDVSIILRRQCFDFSLYFNLKSSRKNRNFLYSLLNLRTSSTALNVLKICVSHLKRDIEAHLGPTLVPNGCWDQKIDHFPYWSVPPSSRSFLVSFFAHFALRVPREGVSHATCDITICLCALLSSVTHIGADSLKWGHCHITDAYVRYWVQ